MDKYKKVGSSILNLYQCGSRYLATYLPLLAMIGIFVLILLTSTCAQVQPLGGGPVDSTPPQLISTNPLHESTGFKGRKIELTFDKEVEIQDVYNRLVITPKLPRLESGPSYMCKARGNKIELRLEVPLEDNTTYTFNFKDAICDIKERTPAENPTLTFSTGNYVDSLYIAGQVKYLLTDQPVKDGLVAIYRITDTDTAHILNTSPDYFTKTNQNGEFKLEHIKQAKYRICAGYSKENKLILDPSKEPYGFVANPIDLSESIDNTIVQIVEANVQDFKLLGSQPQAQYFEISFSKPVTNYTLILAHRIKRFKDMELYSHLIEDKTTIRVYNTLGLLEDDIIQAKLTAQDAMGNVIEENVKLHFRDRMGEKKPFKYTVNPVANAKIDSQFFKADITFTKPIKSIERDNIFLVVGESDTLELSEEEIILHPHRDSITIHKEINLSNLVRGDINTATESEQATNIKLCISKGAFVSVEKDVSESAEYQYTVKNKQDCGMIRGRINTEYPGFIVQLLDEKYQVVMEVRNEYNYEFKDLSPGSYWVRVLGLRKQDAEWSFGNINKLESPDKVAFYPHELLLVANWEFDYIDVEL